MDDDVDWEEKYQELEKRHNKLVGKISFFKKIFFSWGLPRKIEEFNEAVSLNNPVPTPETENLLASLANRALIGTFIGLLLSIGTLGLFTLQTVVLTRQASYMKQQADVLESSLLAAKLTSLKSREQMAKNAIQNVRCKMLNLPENPEPDKATELQLYVVLEKSFRVLNQKGSSWFEEENNSSGMVEHFRVRYFKSRGDLTCFITEYEALQLI